MTRTIDWPPTQFALTESDFTLVDDVPRARVHLALTGYTLDIAGVEVTTVDGVQEPVDDTDPRYRQLLDLYDPEEPWQTWSGFGREWALYGTPAVDGDSATGSAGTTVEAVLGRHAWAGILPEFEERDRKLVTAVVPGHCALHLDARRITGPGQEFAAYPEDRETLAKLAGWDGPYPTLALDGDDFVVFAYPHGD